MPEFNYLAVNAKGKTLQGNIEAGTLKDARRNLRQEGLTLLKIQLSEISVSESKSGKKAKKSKIRM